MSKADDMFKKLGYELDYEDGMEIIYTRFEGHIVRIKQDIIFYKEDKIIKNDLGIDNKELQAINEKCKELEWLND